MVLKRVRRRNYFNIRRRSSTKLTSEFHQFRYDDRLRIFHFGRVLQNANATFLRFRLEVQASLLVSLSWRNKSPKLVPNQQLLFGSCQRLLNRTCLTELFGKHNIDLTGHAMEHSHDKPRYPDLVEGDLYTPVGPMKELIYIDRDDYLDYPALLFDNVDDFQTAFNTERERTARYFPNGVRFRYAVTKTGASSIVLTLSLIHI